MYRSFTVTVLGEIENREIYLDEFLRVTKKGGLVSVSEQAGDPDIMTPEEISDMFRKHGFVFLKKYGGKKNYTVNMKKPD